MNDLNAKLAATIGYQNEDKTRDPRGRKAARPKVCTDKSKQPTWHSYAAPSSVDFRDVNEPNEARI